MELDELRIEAERLSGLILGRIQELKALDFPTSSPNEFLELQKTLFEFLKKKPQR